MRRISLILGLVFCSVVLLGQSEKMLLSLDECRNNALDKNFGVQISREKVSIAENLRKSARTQYFGQLNVVGQYQYTNKPFQILSDNAFMPVVPVWAIDQSTMDISSSILSDPSANGLVVNPMTGEAVLDQDGNPYFLQYAYMPSDGLTIENHHNMIFGPTFNQPLYMGGKIRNINKLAESGIDIANCNYEIEKDEVLFSVDEAYWRCFDLQEKLNLTQKYLVYLERFQYDLENLLDEGLITYDDVLQVKIKKNDLELKKLEIENGMVLSQMALCQIMGIDINQDLYLTDSVIDVELIPDFSVAIENGLANRNELSLLDETKKMALINEKINKSRFLPNASLSANYLFMNPNPYNGFEKEFSGDWSVGISVQIPITHWGDKIHTLNASKDIAQIVQLKKEEAESLISLEIKQVCFKYSEVIQEIALYEESMTLADEESRIVQNKYDEGMATVHDLLEVAAKTQKVNMKLIESKTELKLLETEYKQKTGGL